VRARRSFRFYAIEIVNASEEFMLILQFLVELRTMTILSPKEVSDENEIP
jgi:hypothetical protein